jgi:hypothetical protein
MAQLEEEGGTRFSQNTNTSYERVDVRCSTHSYPAVLGVTKGGMSDISSPELPVSQSIPFFLFQYFHLPSKTLGPPGQVVQSVLEKLPFPPYPSGMRWRIGLSGLEALRRDGATGWGVPSEVFQPCSVRKYRGFSSRAGREGAR